MESLLSSFRREKAKGIESIGTGRGREEIYISKWYAFQRMGFLLDKDKPRETIDSVEENDNAQPSESDEGDVSTEATNSQETEIQTENAPVSPKPRTSAIPVKQIQKRKRLVESSPSVGTSKVDQALGFLKNAAADNDLRDECGVFGQHVTHKLRSYNKITKAIVQHHINNIIFSIFQSINANTNFWAKPFILSILFSSSLP
ncbi:uncharacterized protein [Leptinotarsa decemlineata]|uniref:uncharacterized protein n=1 Tax=Leptinotarsa decemlineata TaxID=7539 RepID=UPI003D30B024